MACAANASRSVPRWVSPGMSNRKWPSWWAAAKRFAELGAHVEQVDPPGGDTIEIFRTLWWGGAGFVFGASPAEKKALLDPDLADIVEEGAAIPLRRYIEANVARGAYASRCGSSWSDMTFC